MAGGAFQGAQDAVSGLNPLSYLNQQQPATVLRVSVARAPTTNDRRYKIGTMWIDTSTNQVYALATVVNNSATWSVLGPGASDVDTITGDSGGALSPAAGNINILGGTGISTSGAGSTLTINAAAGQAPITLYVVDAGGGADYTTVQAAVNAANAAGGGQVFVRPGSYTENLTLFDNIALWGVSEQDTIITGSHTPPASGTLNVFRMSLVSATSIFSSAAAGTTTIIVEDCTLTANSGYVFNLANWTGAIQVFDGACTGTNDGFINNTGGASVALYQTGAGNGTGNDMILSGTTILFDCDVACPVNMQTGASFTIDGCSFAQQLNLDNNSTGTIVNSSFSTGGSAAIDMGSSGAVLLSNCSITSTNNPAIDGAGAGTLTYEGVNFTSNSALAAALTTARGATVGGTARFTTFDTDVAAAAVTLSGTTLAADGTDANIGITVTPKGTGTLSLGDVTSGTTVTVANAINTVAQTVNIANGAAGADSTVNVLSGVATAGTQTLNLAAGASAKAVNIGTGAAANTITIGNTNTTTSVDIDAGSGNVTISGDVELDTGSLAISGAAQQLQVEGGAVTDFIGQATLAAGTVTVANTNIAAGDRILCTRSAVNGSTALGVLITSISASTSFTITAVQPGTPGSTETNDTSIVDYFIVRQL